MPAALSFRDDGGGIISTTAYCGPAPSPADLFAQWNLDPVLLAALAIGAVAAGRLPAARARAGLAAVAVLAVAFVSPLCALTTALFAGRAVHHLLLVVIVAPLLAVAWPPGRVPPVVASVVPALVASTASLWAWHVPALYDAALGSVALYWVMQTTLLGTAYLFWAAVRAAAPVEAIAGVVGGAVQMGFLGALLTFAPRPLYAAHLATTVPYGFGPLADQQLAGLVMWVPGMLPYAIVAGAIAARRWRALAGAGSGVGA